MAKKKELVAFFDDNGVVIKILLHESAAKMRHELLSQEVQPKKGDYHKKARSTG